MYNVLLLRVLVKKIIIRSKERCVDEPWPASLSRAKPMQPTLAEVLNELFASQCDPLALLTILHASLLHSTVKLQAVAGSLFGLQTVTMPL